MAGIDPRFVLIAGVAVVVVLLALIDPSPPRRDRLEYKHARYRARTIAEAQRRYHDEASSLAGSGWSVRGLGWDERAERPTLLATYARPLPESIEAELAWWLHGASRQPLVGAVLTAVSVTVLLWAGLLGLLEGSGIAGEPAAAALALGYLAGMVVGARSEHLGRGRARLVGWVALLLLSFLLLLVLSAVVLFLALWGTTVGFYAAAALAGAWLIARLAIAVAGSAGRASG